MSLLNSLSEIYISSKLRRSPLRLGLSFGFLLRVHGYFGFMVFLAFDLILSRPLIE